MLARTGAPVSHLDRVLIIGAASPEASVLEPCLASRCQLGFPRLASMRLRARAWCPALLPTRFTWRLSASNLACRPRPRLIRSARGGRWTRSALKIFHHFDEALALRLRVACPGDRAVCEASGRSQAKRECRDP